jgi:hypothetical protein
MRKLRNSILLALALAFGTTAAALAQAETIKLSLSRDWGYGGFGGDIQGTFSMHVSGPAGLERVEFFIDDTRIGEDADAPFALQFVTDNYPLGAHTLHATGYTNEDLKLESNVLTAQFVSPSEGTGAALKIVIPILVLVFGAMLVAAVVPILTGRRTIPLEPGAPRSYTLGGGICPKCSRPFGFHLYGLNLLGSKFDRCPYCGKWSAVGHASAEKLRAAEQAEVDRSVAAVPEEAAEEKRRKEIDDSRFQDV